ncbi:MAG: hypothetical protein ABII01_01770 [Candidatus Woesearchaeota archaeon]
MDMIRIIKKKKRIINIIGGKAHHEIGFTPYTIVVALVAFIILKIGYWRKRWI